MKPIEQIEQVRKTIRNWRGPIIGTMLALDDVFYVRLVKSDLLDSLANMESGQVEAREVRGALYIDKFNG